MASSDAKRVGQVAGSIDGVINGSGHGIGWNGKTALCQPNGRNQSFQCGRFACHVRTGEDGDVSFLKNFLFLMYRFSKSIKD